MDDVKIEIMDHTEIFKNKAKMLENKEGEVG